MSSGEQRLTFGCEGESLGPVGREMHRPREWLPGAGETLEGSALSLPWRLGRGTDSAVPSTRHGLSGTALAQAAEVGEAKINRRSPSKFTISIPSVPHGGNVDPTGGIIDAVYYPVIANPYSPKVAVALKPDGTRRSRNLHQGFDSLENSLSDGWRQLLKVLARGTRKGHRVISHAPGPVSDGV